MLVWWWKQAVRSKQGLTYQCAGAPNDARHFPVIFRTLVQCGQVPRAPAGIDVRAAVRQQGPHRLRATVDL